MATVVISQPMFFPWVGMLEQIRQADTYVHYDDVQFSKGSFSNRVQVKTAAGSKWLTVPLRNLHLGQTINQVEIEPMADWITRHLALLEQAYRGAPFAEDMLSLVRGVYALPHANLSELAIESTMALLRYFGIGSGTTFHHSSLLGTPGRNNERVLALVRRCGGDRYVTWHGAKNYLDHEGFAAAGVEVDYLDYQKIPYPQLHGEFTPFVSALDLVANCGRQGISVISSGTISWKEFMARINQAENA